MNCFAKYCFLIPAAFLVYSSPALAQHATGREDSKGLAGVKTASVSDSYAYDSLARFINTGPDDTLKVNRLFDLFDGLAARKIDIALAAKKLAEQLHYYPAIADACVRIGNCYQNENNLSTAAIFCKQAIAIDETHQCYPHIFEHYASLLNLYFYSGDFPAAMKLTTRALATAEKIGNTRMVSNYNSLFGFIYLREGNFAESKKYYTRYFNLAVQLADSLMIADAYNCMGDVYKSLQQYSNALASFFKALSIYSNTSNAGYFDSYKEGVLNRKERRTYTFYKLSSVYRLDGKYEKARQYADSCFKYAKTGGINEYDIAAYYINNGDIYRGMKDYSAALSMLYNGLGLAREIKHREDTRDAYASLAETYAALHKYDSAYLFFASYARLKDSIVNEESSMKIAEIQSQYDSDKTARETARQNLVRNMAVIASVALLTVMLLVYSRYILKQRNKYQQQVNKQQSELFNAVVSAEDKERKRIAQDIHDSLGSVLSAAKLNLSGLEDSKVLLTGAQQKNYETALGLLDDASTELRNISHNLMPPTLLKLGLVAALQNLFDKISATGICIHFTTYGLNARLDEAIEISIYRIMLELVNNIVKHAHAKEVTIQMIRYPNHINITIEDNGSGFDYTQTGHETKGIGLSNILSRIEYLKGTMEIDSAVGSGTTVIIDIPLAGDTAFVV